MRLTKQERKHIREWQARLQAKVGELYRLIAADLGYGDPAQIVAEDTRAAVTAEVETAIERWDEDVEMSDSPPTSTDGAFAGRAL
jgi:hypothetical protein